MIKFEGQKVAMVDVDMATEEITIRFESGVEAQVAFDELTGSKNDISTEFERLRHIRQCLAAITEEIKPTDGLKGSLLAIVAKTCRAGTSKT